MVLSWITATRSQQYAHCPPCRDIISRITLRCNRSHNLWMIRSNLVFGDLSGSRVLLSSPSLLPALHTKLDPAAGRALLLTAASPKRNGQNTRALAASSLPSAVVSEQACCCRASCEFETAAERTHCALTTQSGTAAAWLPGTTGSIWHADEFTHTWWKIMGQHHRHHLCGETVSHEAVEENK